MHMMCGKVTFTNLNAIVPYQSARTIVTLVTTTTLSSSIKTSIGKVIEADVLQVGVIDCSFVPKSGSDLWS